jgi:hypothetical protein
MIDAKGCCFEIVPFFAVPSDVVDFDIERAAYGARERSDSV